MRLRRPHLVLPAAVAPVVALATFGLGSADTVFGTHCGSSADGEDDGGYVTSGATTNCQHSDGPDGTPQAAKKKSTYCVGVKPDPAPLPSTADSTSPVKYSPDSRPLGLYRYPDGREDSRERDEDFEAVFQSQQMGDRGITPWKTVIVKNGGVPTHEKYEVWCQPDTASHPRQKVDEVWVPRMTPNSVAQSVDLLARVRARMKPPTVNFIDSDLDQGWLWVQVEHHLGVPRPTPIYEVDTDYDETGWAHPASVKAWLRATPVALTIQIESAAGEKHLSSCDLDTASSQSGCRMLFTHASSITDDGRFYGIATIAWTLSSNAGTLDGLGPLYTNADFSAQVAEAMAVSGA